MASEKPHLTLLRRYSKELAKYFGDGPNDQTVANKIEALISTFPLEMQFQYMYVIFSAQKQTSRNINEHTDEAKINEIFSKYFLKYIRSIQDTEIINKLFEILGVNKNAEFKREISKEEIDKIKIFYRYYRYFFLLYKKTTEQKPKKKDDTTLYFLNILSEDSNYINDSIGIFDNNSEKYILSIPIIFNLNLFLPLSEISKELDEFKENIEFMSRSLCAVSLERKNINSFTALSNYYEFSYMNTLGESIYPNWDRFLFVYDRIDNPDRLNEEASPFLLKIGKDLQKKFNMCLNFTPSKLRLQVKNDYASAVNLIESARTGQFPRVQNTIPKSRAK